MAERQLGGGVPFGTCTIGVHPFAPGIVHRAVAVEAQWDDAAGGVVLALPDWERMRDELELAGDDAGGGD